MRPTCTSTRASFVIACSASNLNARAQRGNLLVYPSRSRWPKSSTLTTIPSVSYPRAWRLVFHSAQWAITPSIVSNFAVSGLTGNPNAFIRTSDSWCEWTSNPSTLPSA